MTKRIKEKVFIFADGRKTNMADIAGIWQQQGFKLRGVMKI
jgi:hypothetical protein